MENAVSKRYQESVFTGSMFGLLGVKLVTGLVTVVSLGIAYPWLLCWKESWFKSHTYINGRQLDFNGTGMQLIGNWLKWWLLSVITLGIYYFWLPIKIEQWKVKHTYFVDETMAMPVSEPEFNLVEWIAGAAYRAKAFVQKQWKKLDSLINYKKSSGMWVCNCGYYNQAGNKYCNVCGNLRWRGVRCPCCGMLVAQNATFCGYCACSLHKR